MRRLNQFLTIVMATMLLGIFAMGTAAARPTGLLNALTGYQTPVAIATVPADEAFSPVLETKVSSLTSYGILERQRAANAPYVIAMAEKGNGLRHNDRWRQ